MKSCKCGTELIRGICWNCGGYWDAGRQRFYSGDRTRKILSKRILRKAGPVASAFSHHKRPDGQRNGARKLQQISSLPNFAQYETATGTVVDCHYCWEPISIYYITFDHKIPKSEGGTGGDNYLPSCLKCNREKGSMSYDGFVRIKSIQSAEKPTKTRR